MLDDEDIEIMFDDFQKIPCQTGLLVIDQVLDFYDYVRYLMKLCNFDYVDTIRDLYYYNGSVLHVVIREELKNFDPSQLYDWICVINPDDTGTEDITPFLKNFYKNNARIIGLQYD